MTVDKRREDALLDYILDLYAELAQLKARVKAQDEMIDMLWQDGYGEDGRDGSRP